MGQSDISTLKFEGTDFSDILPQFKEIQSKEEVLNVDRTLVLCDIMYDEEFKKLMGIFNTLLSLKEYSQRSINIVNAVIDNIPAYYTAWCFKLDIILALKKNLKEELLWLDEFTLENPKNYQIWSYRIELLQHYTKNKTETECKELLKKENVILSLMIEEDSKNHHVWGYKSWLLNFLELDLEDLNMELTYSEFLIHQDLLNNSAWCFRHNILMRLVTAANNKADRVAIFKEELDYATEKIALYPNNISSWNYYFRILEILRKEDLAYFKEFIIDEASLLCEKHFNNSSYAIEYYCKLLVIVNGDKNKIKNMYILLRDHRDPIRKIYWDYKISQL
ncbi:hypothetical protein QEN19_002311 [Hanseniaspora menglaensis]